MAFSVVYHEAKFSENAAKQGKMRPRALTKVGHCPKLGRFGGHS
jgi:hypothetical protein